MRYVAAVDFADINDDFRMYKAGEEYPRPDLIVSEKRLAELSGSDNRAGYPLIKKDGAEEAPEKPKRTRKRVKGDA